VTILQGYCADARWVDRLDPRVKLAWFLLAVTVALTVDSWLWLLLLSVCLVATSLLAGVSPRSFLRPLVAVALVSVQVLVLNAVFGHTGSVIAHWGAITVHSGAFPLALLAALRVAAVVLASLQFTWWTQPTDLTLLLVWARIPYRFAMLAGLALRFLPLMEAEFAAVVEAQTARGVPMERTTQRLRALVPVSISFLYRSVRRANDTALAMELRGFGHSDRRTFLYDLDLGWWQGGATLAIVVAAVWQLLVAAGLRL
jgi:energy-coupling factor transport system permease protein